MMGLPVLATEYTSAREQIRDGIDGKIVPNSTDGIYEGLRYVMEHHEAVVSWRQTVAKTDYSNGAEMDKVLAAIEGR